MVGLGLPKRVLLAGSARGGTTWALKVLDSHPAISGSHEPFYQLRNEVSLQSFFDRLKAGDSTPESVLEFVQRLAEARVETHKQPFFRKDFLWSPAWLQSLAWLSARTFPALKPIFHLLVTGQLDERHCLVIKNRPFPLLQPILTAIQADVLVLLRNPCAVVNSWLNGMRIGVMGPTSADPQASWNSYSELLEPLGFTETQLVGMSPCGVLAVNWLVDTIMFSRYEASGMKTKRLVYDDLVLNPIEEWTRVFEWLELPMRKSVESFLMNRSHFDIRQLLGKRYAYYSVKRKDKSPVNAWRAHLSDDDVREILDVVTPHFPVENYWPDLSASSRGKMVVA